MILGNFETKNSNFCKRKILRQIFLRKFSWLKTQQARHEMSKILMIRAKKTESIAFCQVSKRKKNPIFFLAALQQSPMID
jgi:hypothetical protein